MILAASVRVNDNVHEARRHVEVWHPVWPLTQISQELTPNHWIVVVGRQTKALALQRRRALSIDQLHNVELLGVLPVRDLVQIVAAVLGTTQPETACADELNCDRIEELLARRWQHELKQIVVEAPRARRRRDHDQHGLPHLEQRHDDLVEDAQVHVGGLLWAARERA